MELDFLFYVYIACNSDDEYFVGVLLDGYLPRGRIDEEKRIVYLRQYEIPFDAMAHKVLLSELSLESLKDIIDKNKDKTEMLVKKLESG